MRYALAWLLYWMGDLVSHVMIHVPDRPEFLGYWAYRLFNRLMLWSHDVQGDGDGPWRGVVVIREDD